MSHENKQEAGQQTFHAYVKGFVSSLILTMMAYYTVVYELFSKPTRIAAIIALALIQAGAQFVYFLHLAQETKPRWNLLVFLFMTMVVFILIFGSIWIMYNLDTRVMTPMEMDAYMKRQG